MVTFFDSAKKGAPHEFIGNYHANQGSGAWKSDQKTFQNQGKNGMKTHLEKTCIFYEFWHHFGRLLAPFWQPKGLQKSSEILNAILEPKKRFNPQLWGSARRNARGPGRIMEGYENQFRQRIPAENQGREPRRRQGTLDVWSSTPSPVGRRIAPRIPPGRGYFDVSFARWVGW